MASFHDKPFYDKWVKNAPRTIKEYLREENTFLRKKIIKGKSVLDVGCGYGRTIQALVGTPSKITGIDNNKRMIRKATLIFRNNPKVDLFLGDAEKMHFSDCHFDYVICMANTFGNLGNKKSKALS